MLVALVAVVGIGLIATPGVDAAGWVHREFDGTTYHDMAWDPVNQRWQGSHPYCLIGTGWL